MRRAVMPAHRATQGRRALLTDWMKRDRFPYTTGQYAPLPNERRDHSGSEGDAFQGKSHARSHETDRAGRIADADPGTKAASGPI